jgi:hypothetical protein
LGEQAPSARFCRAAAPPPPTPDADGRSRFFWRSGRMAACRPSKHRPHTRTEQIADSSIALALLCHAPNPWFAARSAEARLLHTPRCRFIDTLLRPRAPRRHPRAPQSRNHHHCTLLSIPHQHRPGPLPPSRAAPRSLLGRPRPPQRSRRRCARPAPTPPPPPTLLHPPNRHSRPPPPPLHPPSPSPSPSPPQTSTSF